MSDPTNTSIDELDIHMKDLKVLAIILGIMFFVTLGYLYLMTISDNGSAGHPASIHDEIEAADETDAGAEGDTTEADATDGATGFSIDGQVYQLVF